jgi:tricarballylate dehydrogenase
MFDIIVVGGGNAALCAALTAREAGASVLLLESAPFEWRGGNSVHTRNLRCMHDAPQDVLMESYPEEEFWQDLLKVTGGLTNEKLARIVIRGTSTVRDWMRKHGVHFQPSLSGTLHVARTNAFFMGGGKALVNAFFRSAEKLGIQIRYEATVKSVVIEQGEFKSVVLDNGEVIQAKVCVLACGGFESNREWLREAWGQNENGEWPADNFLVRGTKYNRGDVLKNLLDQGVDQIGDPTQGHCVAIDARSPAYDGGICTRLDCVSLGIVVNQYAKRFYDEGEDFWPKRYAIWGRLVALQPGQIAYSIIDSKAIGRFMPPVFSAIKGNTIAEIAQQLKLDENALQQTVEEFNQSCHVGTFNHNIQDDCHTENITPAKTHWALPINQGPFYAYPLRPGITFTYLGLKTDETAAVFFDQKPSPNLFVAGELMSGNVLGKGYTAGIGMSIGTIFGRIAGQSAAQAVMNTKETHANA